jgi:hypothetical protein
MPWGGKRPGSGPKVDPEGERVHITDRVKPSTLKKLKDEAKRLKQSIGRVLRPMVGGAEMMPLNRSFRNAASLPEVPAF